MYVIYVIMESMRESRPYSISDLTTLPEQSVVMMAGLPGGDRSHIAKHLGVMLDAQVVSSEAIRNELSGGRSNAVWFDRRRFLDHRCESYYRRGET